MNISYKEGRREDDNRKRKGLDRIYEAVFTARPVEQNARAEQCNDVAYAGPDGGGGEESGGAAVRGGESMTAIKLQATGLSKEEKKELRKMIRKWNYKRAYKGSEQIHYAIDLMRNESFWMKGKEPLQQDREEGGKKIVTDVILTLPSPGYTDAEAIRKITDKINEALKDMEKSHQVKIIFK